MRQLFPPPLPGVAVDLDDVYWVSDPGPQHVRAVMVASADGAVQLAGRAGGLSGPADARLFAVLRSHADVLLVGATTVRAERYGGDRPSPARQAWRLDRGLTAAPVIAVVTRSCDLDPGGPLFTDTLTRPIVLTCHAAAPERVAALERRADVVMVGEARVDLAAALDRLRERGLRRTSCEGGPTLLAELVRTARLDELSLTISPLLLAGSALRVLHGGPFSQPPQLELLTVLEEDSFMFLRYRFLSTSEGHVR